MVTMKFVVYKEGGSSEIVEATSMENAIAVSGGQSARLAQYIDKVRFGLLDEAVNDILIEEEKPDTPPYDDV